MDLSHRLPAQGVAPKPPFDSEIYVDHRPAAYAFAGERPRKTEAEVMAEAGFAPDGDPA